jgi:GTP-binding protein
MKTVPVCEVKSAVFLKGIVGDDALLHDTTHTVAFIGRSNVGKSSLVNSLAQKKGLVKVGATPGKTREINYFGVGFLAPNANGKSVTHTAHFVDLPGYGFATGSRDEREQILGRIRVYLTTEAVHINTVVLVIDAAVGLTDFDSEMLETLRTKKRHAVIAANKIDKRTQKDKATLMKALAHDAPGIRVFYTSTEKPFGIDALRDFLLINP